MEFSQWLTSTVLVTFIRIKNKTAKKLWFHIFSQRLSAYHAHATLKVIALQKVNITCYRRSTGVLELLIFSDALCLGSKWGRRKAVELLESSGLKVKKVLKLDAQDHVLYVSTK